MSKLIIGDSVQSKNPVDVFKFQLWFSELKDAMVLYTFTLEDTEIFYDLLIEITNTQYKDFSNKVKADIANSPMKKWPTEFGCNYLEVFHVWYYDSEGIQFNVIESKVI